jgi:predicted DNA-binding protein
MEYPKFSFRVAPEIGMRLEEEATKRDVTTSELVREIVTTHYEKGAASGAPGSESVANIADAERRFQQLIFEIGKTRSAILRIGLQAIPEETMEQILAAATNDAKDYTARVAAGMDGLAEEPAERDDASSR